MSASLVGSEMCIRDSGEAAFSNRQVGAARPSPRRGVGESRRPDRADPVSYTHLTLPTICSV
eukprot:11144235-Alexandrium_andersonii.AAC.1